MKETLTILAVGDIVGSPGRDVLKTRLQGIVDIHHVDLVIVNGENAAGGRSITPDIYREIMSAGAGVVTTGNHVWDNAEVLKIIDREPALLRPANYPPGVPGKGHGIFHVKGYRLCVINLMGRTGMEPVDCPFRMFDTIYEQVKESCDAIVVDFHAETTSEKRALGWYVDGRASVFFGTHTHVQTADEEILPGGTGFITDIGMTGAFDSVIGMDKEQSIRKFLYRTRTRFEVASGNPRINAVLFTIDGSGKTVAIQRVVA